MAHLDTVQRSVNTLHDPDPMLVLSESRQGTPVTRAPPTHEPKKLAIPPPTGEDVYPDVYLPISWNYKISEMFYGYTDLSRAEWTILKVWTHSVCCGQNKWY